MNGKVISLNEEHIDMLINGKNNKTLTHEIGHTGGLKHPAEDYSIKFGKYKFFAGPTAGLEGGLNFMNQGAKSQRTPTGPTKDQMYRIYMLYRSGKLNNSNNQLHNE
ncbi:hypothetical protein [Pedobacter sandarakinus]|uniref:hypothetical protein n=1 Tax=Pedobacter sandarakinus TaxID=353156 RepID=UPI0022483D37|nr:hypothetical protein [Pedobacter sandarakinus]MCX2576350.1 hypothetical protein [Pedobacter sandarakinus]